MENPYKEMTPPEMFGLLGAIIALLLLVLLVLGIYHQKALIEIDELKSSNTRLEIDLEHAVNKGKQPAPVPNTKPKKIQLYI